MSDTQPEPLEPPRFFVQMDEDKRALAFFTDTINDPEDIPGDAVEISAELWTEWAEAGGQLRLVKGKLLPIERKDGGDVISTRVAEIWQALGDEDADKLNDAIQAAPARLRRMWEATATLVNRHPSYQELRGLMVTALGEAAVKSLLSEA